MGSEVENRKFTRIGTLLSIRNIHLVGRRRQRINSTFALRFRPGCGQGVNWDGNNPAKLQGSAGEEWTSGREGRGFYEQREACYHYPRQIWRL